MEHRLKVWPQYYEPLARGEKNFEVRRDDRGFQKGDILDLWCYDPESCKYRTSLKKRVSYILTGGQFGIEPGYVVMGLEDI
jgi:hypothetical protein